MWSFSCRHWKSPAALDDCGNCSLHIKILTFLFISWFLFLVITDFFSTCFSGLQSDWTGEGGGEPAVRWPRWAARVPQSFPPLELFIIFTSSFIFLLTLDMSFNTTRDQNMITATEQQEVLTEPDSETSFCSLTFLWFTENHQIKTVQSTLRPREQKLSWHHHVDWPVVGDEVEVDPGHVGSHHLQTLTGELRVGLLVRLQDLEPGLHQVRDALLPHAVFD